MVRPGAIDRHPYLRSLGAALAEERIEHGLLRGRAYEQQRRDEHRTWQPAAAAEWVRRVAVARALRESGPCGGVGQIQREILQNVTVLSSCRD